MNGAAFLKTRRVYAWATKYLNTTDISLHDRLIAEYSPVRCLGDALVHQMIGLLTQTTLSEGEQYTAVNDFYNSLDEDGKRLWDICWKYIRHTLKGWLDSAASRIPMT
jgi:hypothetical protein